MGSYYVNLFRPYPDGARNEMAVTRAFVVACARSPHGSRVFRSLLRQAGVGVELEQTDHSSDETFEWDLEVPAERVRADLIAAPARHRWILSITQTLEATVSAWRSVLERHDDVDHRQALAEMVPRAGASVSADRFETYLRGLYPDLDRELRVQPERRESVIQSAYSDIWRWLWAGARPDAVARTQDFVCLIESKLWGGADEAQVRNHAMKAFGDARPNVAYATWQVVEKTCRSILREVDDPILADLCAYLSEFPQLVRWNGFDADDLAVFGLSEPDAADDVRIRRLRSHYWDCMTDLCAEGGYKATSRRADDWDFKSRRRCERRQRWGRMVGNVTAGREVGGRG